MKRIRIIVTLAALLAAATCTLAAAPAAAQEKTTLAVMDLLDKGAGPDLAANLTDVVTVSLNQLGVFKVTSRADIQKMLEFEQQKQAMGCDDASCLAEIGGALGVALLVSGSVGKVGSGYLVSLTLTDTRTVTVVSREQRQVASADDLTREVGGASRFLVRELLAAAQGDLILTASENEAEVELDGHVIGMTPLGRQTLAGGPHTLKVHKTGFISWARDIEIQKGQPLVVDASLVPSVDFIDAYESRAFWWRLGAYVAGGVGVAMLGFGIGGYIWNGERAAKYERNLVKNGCQVGATELPLRDCSWFDQRKQTIESYDPIVVASMITGTALIGAGVFLFFYGPEPGVYEAYETHAGVSAGLTIVPMGEGGAAVGVFRF